MEAEFSHLPVMLREVIELLAPIPAGLVIDATVGGAGHATAVLDARPDVSLLGIDRDAAAVAVARTRLARFGDRAQIAQGGFEDMARLARQYGTENTDVTGVLMDLGVSSHQLDRPERGFSYRFDAPLDMRMDAKQTLTAAIVVNEYDEGALRDVIARFGEERFARRVAREIVAARPLVTTTDLVDAIKRGIPAPARRRGPHPARRTFQAIRMEVNRELPNLGEGLDESVHLVGPGGRVLVLAYHSLEDRLVKRTFEGWTGRSDDEPANFPVEPTRNALVRLVTRRPLRPSAEEIETNPRAESARLRAVERLAP
ncbi:MAG: rRNA ((1402)-N(4))-methyltransferase [Actinomycetia bacterium]|jgi:16S rRNA (cytosine1402-N4)-methyltransferase|nr:rRNA ((1402)-N(4))-methyltransferase [Actinomycetes bacterium]